MPSKKNPAEVEPWEGWGLRVGGSRPYMGHIFCATGEEVQEEFTEDYHKAVKAVVLPLARYEELLKAEKKLAKLQEKANG